MLINIDPILSPELLSIIRSMGHGDKLVLCDANYPAVSTSNKITRMDGVNIPKAAEAILSVFPLDSFIPEPVRRMEIDGRPDEINECEPYLKKQLKIIRPKLIVALGRISAMTLLRKKESKFTWSDYP